MADIISFFESVVYWHLHPDQYYADIFFVDMFFCFLLWFGWNFGYMVIRKRLHVRDFSGRDRIIGYICMKKEWAVAPNGLPSMYLIKFRRKGLYFLKDLIHRSRLYYQPKEGVKKPFFKRLRDMYISGDVMNFHHHHESVTENYYYLGPKNAVRGEFERMGNYIEMGQQYVGLMAKTCQIAIQCDAELTAERYQLDTVPTLPPVNIMQLEVDDNVKKLPGSLDG